jgi:hypothetical protein
MLALLFEFALHDARRGRSSMFRSCRPGWAVTTRGAMSSVRSLIRSIGTTAVRCYSATGAVVAAPQLTFTRVTSGASGPC